MREHCFNSVADAMLGRQRARDWMTSHNAAIEAKRAAGTLLDYSTERVLALHETEPKCYSITLRRR